MINYDVPVFNPFTNAESDSYYPSNDAAHKLMQIQYAWEDILHLLKIRNAVSEPYQKQLLHKYTVLEWYSLDVPLRSLVKMALRGEGEFEASESDKTKLKDEYKRYRSVRKKNYKSLKLVRDKLAAHRDPLGPRQVSDLWLSINRNDLYDVLKPIPDLYAIIKDLNIYTWSLSQSDENVESIAFVQPLVIRDP